MGEPDYYLAICHIYDKSLLELENFVVKHYKVPSRLRPGQYTLHTHLRLRSDNTIILLLKSYIALVKPIVDKGSIDVCLQVDIYSSQGNFELTVEEIKVLSLSGLAIVVNFIDNH